MSGAPLIELGTGKMIGIQVGRARAGEILLGLPSSLWAAELDGIR